jgi:hypothetical protein
MESVITSSRGQSTLQRGQIAHWQVPSQSCPRLKQVEQALSICTNVFYHEQGYPLEAVMNELAVLV